MLLIVPAENSPLPVIPSPDDSSWRDHASTMEGSEVVVPPPGAATAQLQSFRDVVQVPEFRLIKRIGSGAYGEVWLAQSVTGAMRAVKIVWREEFELTCFQCVEALLAKTGVRPEQIKFVVTNSSLFNPTPSLSAMIMNRFKMPSTTINYNLGGMGCSGEAGWTWPGGSGCALCGRG